MLLLAGSKKALLFMIISLTALIFYVTRGFPLQKKIRGLLIFVAVLSLALYCVKNLAIFHTINIRMEQMINTFTGKGVTSVSDLNRLNYIKVGLSAFIESPIWGKGTGYSYVVFGTYSHNNFVEILMNYGLIGFILYYAPYFLIFPKLTKCAKKGDLNAIYFLIFAILATFLGLASVNYYERTTQLIIASSWGYTDIFRRNENEN